MVEIGRRLPFSPIVTLEDAWEDPSNFYIIMELFGAWSVSPSLAPIDIPATPFHQAPLSIPFLMGSGDLHGFVQELVGNLGNLSPAICKGLVRQCGQGLHDLHCMQAYHGDVKLSNYLVRYSGGLIEVVLSDLGHCKQTSIHPTFYGTPLLTAPEFLGGYSRHIPKDGCAADVFALGLVFFQLLFSNLFPSIMMNIATGSIGYMQVAASGGASGSLPLDNLGQFLDPEALHLLQGMLMINPCDRFNMAQVMAHPCLN
ncbi:kinase-like domain-containing protein [Obelidium mucronatum]|nr:kinase-like domain-containing protein [Obelidium mucronatum]